MVYCKKCGSELVSGETQCRKCGENTESNTLQDSDMKREKLNDKKHNRIVWIIVGATAAIVAVALVILFVVILPTEETEPLLSTPIGDFTYTQSFSDTFGQSAAKRGYTLLVITFLPVNDKKTSSSSAEEFSMMKVRAILGDDKYDASIMQETYGAEGQSSTFVLVFAVPKSRDGDIAVVVLP